MTRMSERLWGLRWEEHLPWDLGGGVTLHAGTLDDALGFVAEHHSTIFRTGEHGSRAFAEEMTEAKRRFLSEADVFLAMDAGRLVGIFIAHPTDWSTYYHRMAAFLPQYQGRALINEFSAHTEAQLRRVGCMRIEADTAATNGPMLRVFARLGFNVVSTTLSDRWGAMIRVSRLLSEEAQSAFADQFSCGVRHAGRGEIPGGGPERRHP